MIAHKVRIDRPSASAGDRDPDQTEKLSIIEVMGTAMTRPWLGRGATLHARRPSGGARGPHWGCACVACASAPTDFGRA
jgi:hypothetical protein